MDLKPETEFAIESVVAASAILREYTDARVRQDATREKGAGDVVTEADHRINEFLINRIVAAYPSDAICAEEGSPCDDPRASRRWIIDPIDGTKSFIAGSEGYSIMLALVIDGEPSVAAVFEPHKDCTWFAATGQGLRVRDNDAERALTPVRENSTLIWNRFVDREIGEGIQRDLALDSLEIVESFGLRGVALSRHRVGAYVSRPGSPHVWDTAPAWLFTHESGGQMTGYDGEPLAFQDEATCHPSGAVASVGLDHAKVIAAATRHWSV